VGDITFPICKDVLDDMRLIPEGRVCSTILKLYNEDAIVVEPAGALSVAALEDFAAEIKGKTVVCIVSGSNNDIDRMPEIKRAQSAIRRIETLFPDPLSTTTTRVKRICK
jgi:threonine dehydratase